VAEERGEIEAGIISAIPLSAEQERSLTDVLRERLGKTPKLNITVNPSLLGGLIVKVSSQMVDTSLRTKLNSIKIAMKEAG
jgi:F-type H+-transporting ATPase subunit delta